MFAFTSVVCTSGNLCRDDSSVRATAPPLRGTAAWRKGRPRVLGGGIVPGSVVLISGDPGIGKSTLLIQLCAALAEGGGPVLYVSGEESERQIKMRALRLLPTEEKEAAAPPMPESLYLVTETNLNVILETLTESGRHLALEIELTHPKTSHQ